VLLQQHGSCLYSVRSTQHTNEHLSRFSALRTELVPGEAFRCSLWLVVAIHLASRRAETARSLQRRRTGQQACANSDSSPQQGNRRSRLDLRPPPRSKWDLRSSGMLHNVGLYRNVGNHAQIALRNFLPATRHLNGRSSYLDLWRNGTVPLIVTSAVLVNRRKLRHKQLQCNYFRYAAWKRIVATVTFNTQPDVTRH